MLYMQLLHLGLLERICSEHTCASSAQSTTSIGISGEGQRARQVEEGINMEPVKVLLKLKAEKKHSVRYDAIADGQAISSVYVSKETLTKPWPKVIAVTIEEGQDAG